jgi:Antirestriction protein (ArdA)
MTAPRIYVACLAAYNNGRLHGEWIDADQPADEQPAHPPMHYPKPLLSW